MKHLIQCAEPSHVFFLFSPKRGSSSTLHHKSHNFTGRRGRTRHYLMGDMSIIPSTSSTHFFFVPFFVYVAARHKQPPPAALSLTLFQPVPPGRRKTRDWCTVQHFLVTWGRCLLLNYWIIHLTGLNSSSFSRRRSCIGKTACLKTGLKVWPAECCAEKIFAAVCTLAAGSRRAWLSFYCVLPGGRQCQGDIRRLHMVPV